MRRTHVSVSKHLKRIKRGAWICPHAWKIDSTRPLIKVNYASPLRPFQAALKVAESVPTAKTLKKNLNYLNIFLCSDKSPKGLLK